MKIEVGYQTEDKKLVIADVIDNDSWRIWPNGDPKQQLDKQSFRDGESLTEVQEKYRIVTEYTKDF
jgi:phosphoribosylaminoimidazole-succinocarboxamide synthase